MLVLCQLDVGITLPDNITPHVICAIMLNEATDASFRMKKPAPKYHPDWQNAASSPRMIYLVSICTLKFKKMLFKMKAMQYNTI